MKNYKPKDEDGTVQHSGISTPRGESMGVGVAREDSIKKQMNMTQ